MVEPAAAPKPNLYGLERRALERTVAELSAPEFHGRQVYRWMYSGDVLDPEGWTDLPRSLRSRLSTDFRFDAGSLSRHRQASDDTVKYRVDTPCGDTVESVYMESEDRVTMCISSQVGCALDCDFCLTGKMGFRRHLDAGEIVGQVALIRREHALRERPFNVVFMGMGEPLHNFDAVTRAVRLLCDPDGFGLSRRRLTVSTVGLAPAIERLAEEPVHPRLAVSLNATTDEVRDRLMPVNRRYPLARLFEACRNYAERTGDRFTFEYVLLGGVNDTDADVDRLAAILRRHRAKLNLIPFNTVPDWLRYAPPESGRVSVIRDRLLSMGLPVSVRWSRGRDARAACGQLALLEGRR